MKQLLTMLGGLGFLVLHVNGTVVGLFENASDVANINSRLESDGSTYIAASVDGSGTIGSGDALRVADLSADDKPEAVWDVAPMTGGFRLDMDAYQNGHVDDSSVDINLRFSDSEDTISSSSNVMATISFEADSLLKMNGSSVASFGSAPLALSFVFNVSTVDALNYTLFGSSETLAASSVSTYVDGILADTREMSYGANFDPSLGVARLGFIGESDSKLDADYLFDNVFLYTGSDISTGAVPEPSTYAMILGGLMLAFIARRRIGSEK